MPRLLSSAIRDEIVSLRETGHSIPEIHSITGKSKSTISRIVQGVLVRKEFKEVLRVKQGGAKERARSLRARIVAKVEEDLLPLSNRDKLLLLLGLYWGEGTKRDFSIINSDPFLIQTFIHTLACLQISEDRLTFSIRIHEGISPQPAVAYWSKITGLHKTRIGRIEVVKGKKKGKLPHGMCRVRIRSGIKERLYIQSAISQVGKECAKN